MRVLSWFAYSEYLADMAGLKSSCCSVIIRRTKVKYSTPKFEANMVLDASCPYENKLQIALIKTSLGSMPSAYEREMCM